jgi:hypothetical protein
MIHRATEIEKTYSIDNEQLSSSTRAYQEYEKLLNELVSRGVIDVEA